MQSARNPKKKDPSDRWEHREAAPRIKRSFVNRRQKTQSTDSVPPGSTGDPHAFEGFPSPHFSHKLKKTSDNTEQRNRIEEKERNSVTFINQSVSKRESMDDFIKFSSAETTWETQVALTHLKPGEKINKWPTAFKFNIFLTNLKSN